MATASTPSPVANLSELDNRVTVDSLQTAVGYEFLRTPAMHLEDGGQNLISKQRGFQFVNPTDDWFPGSYFCTHISPTPTPYLALQVKLNGVSDACFDASQPSPVWK